MFTLESMINRNNYAPISIKPAGGGGGGGVEWHPHLFVLQKVKKLFDKVYLASARWRENVIKLLFGLIQLFVSMRPKFEV